MPPGSHGPTDPPASATGAFGDDPEVRPDLLHRPVGEREPVGAEEVDAARHSAPRRMASATRAAMPEPARWPGEYSNRPRPVRR